VTSLRQHELQRQDAALLGAVGLIERSRDLPRPVYVALVSGLALVTFGLGFAALALTPAGGTAAIWWPAAGTSALLALLYRGPRWQVLLLVAVVAASSNLLIGRPPVFALWAVVILVSELIVFVAVLGPQGRTAMLSTTRGLTRFIFAALAGATVVGVIGSSAFVVLVGADPLVTFTSLVPSHLSALLLIVPIALVPLPRGLSRQRTELLVQGGLTAAIVLLIFAPFQSEAVGALLFPFFGWAATRFPPIVATVELVLLGTLASVLTVLGGGPYAGVSTGLPAALLVQVYLLSMAITIHFMTTVRSERAELRAENDRRAALLRGGFVGSQVGSAFVRADEQGAPTVLEANTVAETLIASSWFEPFIAAWASSGAVAVSTEVLLDDGRTLQVYGRQVETADGEPVLGVQLVDISDFVAAQRAMVEVVERERTVVEELRALAQQKDDFVSAVSHELRTPITSIVGFAEELNETATPSQRQATEIIMRNANRLTEMVEELLELGRMTAPNPVRERGIHDLGQFTRDVIADQSATARERGIVVEAVLWKDVTPVEGSSGSLIRIITNLLSNALKFAPDGGVVRVTTSSDERTVTLAVDDSGPGISEADAPHVFDRFFRSNDPAKRQTPGTGLGLSITRSLVELLGGTIAVERSPLGGARLVVRLPRAAVEEAATP
jgi:signal transduction histidine kinase